MLFDAMDLGATFVFAISGATRGVRRQLDLFGVLVVAWVAAVAGGITRDLLIGAVPPAAIADWRYLVAAIAAGLLGFFASDAIARLKTPVLLFDAAGLCLFAVTGTQKALAYGLTPVMAAMMGMITCIGGGVARDLLTLQVDGTHGSAVAGLRRCFTQSRVNTPKPVWNPDIAQPIDFFAGWQEVPDNAPVENAFKAQWELYLKHVAGEGDFRWDLMEGARGVQLAELGLKSWKQRKWLDVPALKA